MKKVAATLVATIAALTLAGSVLAAEAGKEYSPTGELLKKEEALKGKLGQKEADVKEKLGKKEQELKAKKAKQDEKAAEMKKKRQEKAAELEKQKQEAVQKVEDKKKAVGEAKEKANGKKPGGKPPKPPQVGPRPDDQINLTDEESRIMKVAGGGFEQCYNAQALVDSESMLVMAPHVTQAGNDKEQVVPMLAKLQALPEELNQPEKFLADSGYFSEKNVEACEAARIEPLIAVGRDAHHRHWRERFEEPAASSEPTSPVDKMKHRLKTKAGRAAYGQRKQTVEPVFGIIKSVMGFRQFLLRGLANVQNEWTLVCLAWNLKRMATLRPHSVQNA